MKIILAVAAGGAIGAILRHLVNGWSLHWFGSGFPWSTLFVNILGCFLMGVLVETSALLWSPGPALRAMIAVGFLGALTTFSSFSLDAATLYGRGALMTTAAYVIGSVVLSISAFFVALALVRALAR
jgi:fluoride exporter